VPDTAAILEGWRVYSAAYRRLHPALLDQAWGPHPRQATDFFDCDVAAAPTLLFVHGGYWHYPQHSREAFSALAAGLVERGVHVALAGYRLAPEATLRDILDDIATAISHLADLRRTVGADPARLCVAGWSAGGHLAALLRRLPGVSACLAISGIFDLEPMRLCFVGDKLGLSPDDVSALSPIHRLPPPHVRLAVSVGGEELPELRRLPCKRRRVSFLGAGRPQPFYDPRRTCRRRRRPRARSVSIAGLRFVNSIPNCIDLCYKSYNAP
jgi:hypothetical protein